MRVGEVNFGDDDDLVAAIKAAEEGEAGGEGEDRAGACDPPPKLSKAQVQAEVLRCFEDLQEIAVGDMLEGLDTQLEDRYQELGTFYQNYKESDVSEILKALEDDNFLMYRDGVIFSAGSTD